MKKMILAIGLLISTNLWARHSDDLSAKKAKDQVVTLEVTEEGFQPKSLDVQPNKSTILKITRKTDSTCAKQIQIPSQNIKMDLPLNQVVSINVGKLEKGEIRFGCGMDMMDAGIIHVR
jgi:plastocyanin domain-containing protein